MTLGPPNKALQRPAGSLSRRCAKTLVDVFLNANIAVRFAIVGSAIAAAIALSVFGWYWIYLPGAIAALVATYVVSATLGRFAESKARGMPACLLAGVGTAVATVFSAVVSFGALGVFLAWLEDVTPIRTGAGPYSSLGNAIWDFIVKPLYWVFLVGGWIAVVLGIVYGSLLHLRHRQRQ